MLKKWNLNGSLKRYKPSRTNTQKDVQYFRQGKKRQGTVDFYFCIPVPSNKKDICFDVSSKRSSKFIEPFNFSFFSITGWGKGLDYCDIEWFALETNRDHSAVFEIASNYFILDFFVDHDED